MPHDTPLKATTGGKPTLMAKPSLSGSGQHKNDGADSRILSNSKMGPLIAPYNKKQPFAPGTASPFSGLGPKLAFALSGIAVMVIGAYLYIQDRGPTSDRTATQEPVVAVAAPIALPVPAPEPVLEQPAQIVNEPQPSAPVPEPSPAKLANALEAGVQPPPAALANALQANSSPTKNEIAAQKKADALASKKAASASVRPAAVAQPPAANVAAAQALAPAAAPKATMTPAAVAVASEKDIKLLAALVAHNNSSAPNPASDTAHANAARPVEESAESLLRRCATLEPDRQAPCRAKVCTGARVNEPACKPVVQPGTAAPVTAPVAPANGGGLSPLPLFLPAVKPLPATPGLTPAQ